MSSNRPQIISSEESRRLATYTNDLMQVSRLKADAEQQHYKAQQLRQNATIYQEQAILANKKLNTSFLSQLEISAIKAVQETEGLYRSQAQKELNRQGDLNAQILSREQQLSQLARASMDAQDVDELKRKQSFQESASNAISSQKEVELKRSSQFQETAQTSIDSQDLRELNRKQGFEEDFRKAETDVAEQRLNAAFSLSNKVRSTVSGATNDMLDISHSVAQQLLQLRQGTDREVGSIVARFANNGIMGSANANAIILRDMNEKAAMAELQVNYAMEKNKLIGTTAQNEIQDLTAQFSLFSANLGASLNNLEARRINLNTLSEAERSNIYKELETSRGNLNVLSDLERTNLQDSIETGRINLNTLSVKERSNILSQLIQKRGDLTDLNAMQQTNIYQQGTLERAALEANTSYQLALFNAEMTDLANRTNLEKQSTMYDVLVKTYQDETSAKLSTFQATQSESLATQALKAAEFSLLGSDSKVDYIRLKG